MRWRPTFSTGGGYLGGMMANNANITYTNSFYIYASLLDQSVHTANAGAGFAAFTLFNALPSIIQGTSNDLVQMLVLNDGGAHRRTTSGTSTTPQHITVSSAPVIRADVAGATMTWTTGGTGLSFRPAFNTQTVTSTVNFGTLRAVHMQQPITILFGNANGAENITNYIGLDMGTFVLPVSGVAAAVRSAMTDAANRYFLLNTGGARSDFGGGNLLDCGIIQILADNLSLSLGAAGGDVQLNWNGSAFEWDFLVGDDLRLSAGASNEHILQGASFGSGAEFRFGFDRFAFGQTGAVGNQVGVFVAPARTVPVAGGWSDFLLTQAGNLDIDTLAMSDVAAWTVNAISLDAATGSITSLDTFVVGGMTTSNPGITVTERSAMRITGRLKQRGSVQYPPINPAALAAGDNDDWAGLLTGSANNNTREWGRVTGNATTSVITGIDATAVQDGDSFTLTNVGTETILLSHEDTGSSAANRIITQDANRFVLSERASVQMRYDGTTARWRIITPPGAVAPLSGEWQFDSTTTMADPGDGNFRNNNGTLASVTAIAIADETKPGVDTGNILNALDNGDQLYIQNKEDGNEFMVFDVSGVPTDNGSWVQVPGSVNASGSSFTDGKEFIITAIFA